jgi:hypothetical protein
MTVRDYDLSEISKLVCVLLHPSMDARISLECQLRAVYFGVALMGVLHLYFKFNPPLFIQGIMGLKNLYDNKIVSLHIFGRPAEGDLKRPFKSPPGLFGGKSCSAFSVVHMGHFPCLNIHLHPTVPIANDLIVVPGATGPQTDSAAITEAEKRVGSKKED